MSATRTDDLLGDGEASASALTGGCHLAFWIGAALILAALFVAVTVLQAPKQSSVPSENSNPSVPVSQ